MDVAITVSVACFYLFVFLVGYYASKKQTKKNPEANDMLLAGRNMPLWIGFLTLTATWVGGGYINGTAESIYSSGAVWTQAPWGYALSLIVGGLFFAKAMRAKAYTTLLDPFQEKYGKEYTALLFLPALIGELFWSAAILTALGLTFATIFHLDMTTAIVVSSTVSIIYTLMGGLWSVAYTDIVQIIFIALGLSLSIPFVLYSAGGWDEVSANYFKTFAHDANLFPPLDAWRGLIDVKTGSWGPKIWYWLDSALLLVFGGIPWGSYFQRVLACPTPNTARNLSFLAAFACMLMAIPPAIIGMAGSSFHWQEVFGFVPEKAMILPSVLYYLTPKWVGVLGIGAVASAVMSSVDSSILSMSSMFVWNVYRPWTKKVPSDKKIILLTKLAILCTGITAAYIAIRVKSVYSLWFLCSDLVYVVLFPQLLCVLFLPEVKKAGAVAGFCVALILRVGGGEMSLGIPSFINYPWPDPELGFLFPFKSFAMLSSLLTIVVISKLAAYKIIPNATMKTTRGPLSAHKL